MAEGSIRASVAREVGVVTGIEFRQKREAMELSQMELAAILKVKQATISGWETGKRAISHPVVLAMVEVERQQKKRVNRNG